MADTAMVSQLKFRITSLESQLVDKQRQLEQYQTIESEADAKIKALSKMHADKVKSLLNSIQILKKEKASIEGLSKEHKRSKLIQQLNKEINDQDIVIEVLRKYVYDKEGKEQGRNVCDDIIVKALTKGPDRIRPLSREQLRMEIDKLKSINISLEGKFKNGNKGKQGGTQKIRDDVSEIESISDHSFVNHNEEILKKMKQIQLENENMKLQANAKLKIIEKLKFDLKEKDKLKAQLQISKNQIEVVNQKLKTFEKLMKESKENTNAKIIELYEREVKVQELQMISKENSDKLKQAQQSHNVLLEEIKLEKEHLEAEIESLKSENEQLILENIAGKKRLEEVKKILKEMGDMNDKQKEDLKQKLEQSEQNIAGIVADNKKYKDAYQNVQTTLFKERADWVQEKAKLLEELAEKRQSAGSKELIGKYMQDIANLREENEKLRKLLEGGGGSGDDHLLLERLQNYKRKLQFYESKGNKDVQKNYYDELFQKYNQLAQEFHQYKLKYGEKEKGRRIARKHYVEVNRKEESELENMTSGISNLNLSEVDADLLQNFDSSYDYEIVVNEWGKEVKVPKITEADKQLLKLITSDLWNFVKADEMGHKIQQAKDSYVLDDEIEDDRGVDMNEVRKIKNLTNPRGKKVVVYEEEVEKLGGISEDVSITSALEKQLNKFDSDVEIDMRRYPRGASKAINAYKMDDISVSVSNNGSFQSSVKEGDSQIGKKKKKRTEDKGSRLDIKKLPESQMDIRSSLSSSLLDSNVSSYGFNDSELEKIDSDVDEGRFKKKK